MKAKKSLIWLVLVLMATPSLANPCIDCRKAALVQLQLCYFRSTTDAEKKACNDKSDADLTACAQGACNY